MESEVGWWQVTCCSTGASSRASEANAAHLWALNFPFTFGRGRGLLLAKQNGLPWSPVSISLISSTTYFCFLVWLLSVFAWWTLQVCGGWANAVTLCLKDESIGITSHWKLIRVAECVPLEIDTFRNRIHVKQYWPCLILWSALTENIS